jgi:hypothetical protein
MAVGQAMNQKMTSMCPKASEIQAKVAAVHAFRFGDEKIELSWFLFLL